MERHGSYERARRCGLLPAVLTGCDGAQAETPARFDEGLLTQVLEAARSPAGMYRFTELGHDGELQAGWVVLNDGALFGVDSGGGSLKSREIAGGSSVDAPLAAGSTPRRWRGGRHVHLQPLPLRQADPARESL